jgi:hypothetical protein
MARQAGAVLGMLFLAHAAAAQFVQQGNKLVGAGTAGPAWQGFSVAISADGSTAIVGGPGDNGVGAAWVYTRRNGVWLQQGSKLAGSLAVGISQQGTSVAISADGNTAIVGGPGDEFVGPAGLGVGAAWVYVRSGGVWSQQGSKLVGTGAVDHAQQGRSVAISADGNTAIVGGPTDNYYAGAAWVYTRSGGVWAQQGSRLVGTGAIGNAYQGDSVAISGDGNIAIVGGSGDNDNSGATWVFARSGGVWSQQGAKLVGTGAAGPAEQGQSVALSGDGDTALVGGSYDNSCDGAAWVFTRSGGVWSQQGSKLTGSGAIERSFCVVQGHSVAISGDGNIAIVGGPGDNDDAGAAWVFTRNGGVWSQQRSKLVGAGAVGAAYQGGSVAITADGNTAIVGGYADDPIPVGPTVQGTGAAWVFTASSFSVWVPVASHTSGKNNSQWRSDLGLLNAGSVTANAQITFFLGGALVSNTTYVPAGAQSILTDVVGQLGASGSGALGIISDQPLKVTARTYNQALSTANCYADGTQGQDYPAVTSSAGLAATQGAYLAGLTENASYRCNIGVVNTGTGSAAVLVELFDGVGTKLTDYTVSLVAGQWAQETQPFFTKATQTAMDRGYARITVQTGSGVFAFASVIDNVTNDPTTVAMQR